MQKLGQLFHKKNPVKLNSVKRYVPVGFFI